MTTPAPENAIEEIKPLTRKQWAEALSIAPGGLMPDRQIYDEDDDTTLAPIG